ncbi:hypothetical protein CRUP_030043 [Coryphaenoides rupestris]|nr:hypothetical protein CRUP_030043 [Coryphaenoides rupestris]
MSGTQRRRRTRGGPEEVQPGRRSGETEDDLRVQRLYRRVEETTTAGSGGVGGGRPSAAGMTDRVASCGSLYDSTNLLLQYCNNETALNTCKVLPATKADRRISMTRCRPGVTWTWRTASPSWRQRLQLQEDEVQLLKAALADALRRLGCCEDQGRGGARGRGVRRSPGDTGGPRPPPPPPPPSKKRLLSSPSSPKKDVLQSMKRKSMSTERLTLVKREAAAGGGEEAERSRSRTTSSSSSSEGKKPLS